MKRGRKFVSHFPVPRFYFHLRDEFDAPDEEGVELPDVQAARQWAIIEIRELLCEQVRAGTLALERRIDIEEVNG